MPEHFSPSRSLKYCFITLRTVSDSSFSRAPSERASDLCLGCKGDLVLLDVLERRGVRAQPVEEFRHGGELHLGPLERVHARAEDGRVLEPLGVPADVLAR